jgi:hypothetical protein
MKVNKAYSPGIVSFLLEVTVGIEALVLGDCKGCSVGAKLGVAVGMPTWNRVGRAVDIIEGTAEGISQGTLLKTWRCSRNVTFETSHRITVGSAEDIIITGIAEGTSLRTLLGNCTG